MIALHIFAVLAAAIIAAPTTTRAQDWPSRPIRIIVPFPAGGSSDVAARVIGQYMSKSLGQQVYVENKSGANGNIGIEAGAKSAPDGYTLLLGTDAVTSNPIPKGQSAANRKDIELLFDDLPEPIDLDLDLANRTIYWTDRGDPPRGNTVNRGPMDAMPGNRKDPEIVFNHLMEGIGLALDLKGRRMFLTDLGGSVYSASLDGSNKKVVLVAQGNLTGIAYAELPAST
jgi:Tripartite tricarboxylate transporter family receptor